MSIGLFILIITAAYTGAIALVMYAAIQAILKRLKRKGVTEK